MYSRVELFSDFKYTCCFVYYRQCNFMYAYLLCTVMYSISEKKNSINVFY